MRLISLRRHVEKMRNDFKIKEQEIQKIRSKTLMGACILNIIVANKITENI